jgi:parallel beta-helix repeat protein
VNRSRRLRRTQESCFDLCWLFVSLALSACVLSAAENEETLIPHAPITILNASQFTSDVGVVEGSGTPADPYIIRGHEIDATDASYGIYIEGTTETFRIEGCSVIGAISTGIKLVDVHDATIEGCTISSSRLGIGLNNVQHTIVQYNCIQSCEHIALTLSASSHNSITGNTMTNGGMGIYLVEKSTNNTISDNVISCAQPIFIQSQSGGNSIYRNDFYKGRGKSAAYNRWENRDGEGNYWQVYFGADIDQDGVGDTPFRLLGEAYEYDSHPAMNPFYPDRLLQTEVD